jgi:hypothetical protein
MVLVVWELVLAMAWLVWYPLGTWIDVQLYKNRITRKLVAGGPVAGPVRSRDIYKAYLYRNLVEVIIFSIGFFIGLLLRLPIP